MTIKQIEKDEVFDYIKQDKHVYYIANLDKNKPLLVEVGNTYVESVKRRIQDEGAIFFIIEGMDDEQPNDDVEQPTEDVEPPVEDETITDEENPTEEEKTDAVDDNGTTEGDVDGD